MKKNPLAAARPDLAMQFHISKNPGISPDEISYLHKGEVWWLCEKGHEWRESPYNRSHQPDSNCKTCQASLACTHPKLLSLWHPTKNIGHCPYSVTAKAHKKIWWKCPIGEEHEWQAPPYNIARLKNTTGCPVCRGFKVIKSNCLATTHPELASEWDYEKNGALT